MSTGTGLLLRAALRRDRVRLAVWAVALGGLVVYAANGLATVYPTAADRQARAALMGEPAAVMLSGPGFGTEDYTLGAMLANELGLTVMVAAAIMSIQLLVRHTRAEEEAGRAELLRAGAVARSAPLTAALGVVGLADTAVAVVVAGGLAASGLGAADALALAAGIAVTGVAFGAVAAVTAQLTSHARAASGAALAVLAAAAVVRGIGDVQRPGGSALSWLSPIAWAQQTRAFVDLRWWPLLLSLALVAVLVALGHLLAGRRDLGAGLLPARRGPAGASPLLSGPTGLAVRLQRASIAGWAVAVLLLGLVFGSLAQGVTEMAAGNARITAALAAAGRGDRGLADAFFATTALELSLAVAGFAVGSVLRLRREESAGRVEVLLATPLDRRVLLGGSLAVTAGASVLLLVVAGLGCGLAAAAVTGDTASVAALLGALLVPLPAVLVLAGVAAALVGLAPRLAGLAWLPLGWALLVTLFGPLLGVPRWATRLSPFGWLPAVPAQDVDVAPLAALTAVAAALVVLALLAFRRRDTTG